MADELAEIVRVLRERALLSQEELAARSGLSVGTIRGLEAGRIHRPRAATMRQLTDALCPPGPDRRRLLAAAGVRYEEAVAEPEQERAVPAQLPAAVAGFVGRTDALRALDNLLDTAEGDAVAPVVVSAIAGTAGIGKTALAVWWAHRVVDRFPDGQLFVNLRGFDPAGPPMPPGEAVRGFLDGLQVPPQRIPSTLDAQVGLYRSVLAHRRMLILLDNARDADHVRPLLPGTPGCLALITSRNSLTGLAATNGARLVALDLLSRDEARQLLARRIGPDRVHAERGAVDRIVERCARLPLALAIVAARAAAQPQLPLATLAAQLRDTGLDAVTGDDTLTDVRAVFGWSYHALKPEAARLFRLLGLHPGPDLTPPAASSLAARPVPDTRRLLATLTAAHLVTEYRPGRYTLHDLLRTYAAELVATHDSADEGRAALTRLLDHYLHAAYTAGRLLKPNRDPMSVPLAPPAPGSTPEHPTDLQQAMDWLDTERRVLLAGLRHAVRNGFDTHAWQLAWSLDDFFDRRGHWHARAAAWQDAVGAADRLDLPAAHAYAHHALGQAETRLGRGDEAHDHLHRALDLYVQLGDPVGQAASHSHLATAWWRQGHLEQALHHSRQALTMFESAGHQRGQAIALNSVGWYQAMLGKHAQALDHCGRALSLYRQLGDHYGQANTWDSLGYANRLMGHHARAVDCYQHAIALFRQLGDRYNEATSLTNLGDAHEAAGQPDAARGVWLEAVAIHRAIGLPDRAAQVEAKLDRLTAEQPDGTVDLTVFPA